MVVDMMEFLARGHALWYTSRQSRKDVGCVLRRLPLNQLAEYEDSKACHSLRH